MEPDVPWPIARRPALESVKLGACTVKASVVVTVRLPEIPVTVSVLVPPVAEELTVKVRTLLVVVELGEKEAVTPLGKPDTERFTLPVNPYSGVTVIVDVPDALGATPRVPGAAERRKVGVWTATVTLAVDVSSPEVPAIVKFVVDAGAVLLAVSVNTLVAAVGFVPHDAVTPLGNVDVTARLTLPVNPPASVTVSVVELEDPWLSETLPGAPSIQKPGTCGPARSLIRSGPVGLPHPVTRS